ncbi:ThuA domain-containing protein [Pontiella sp.]|uniref:ThuA domain-containing protein n=1 Tax=Pontiella sp. TaxID=2837462 RepID=UPI003567C628
MKTTLLCIVALVLVSVSSEAKLKVLIMDGQNNHAVWPKATIMMKQYLEDSGLFDVELARTKYTWKGGREKAYLDLAGLPGEDLPKAKSDPDFSPDFTQYDLVVNNLGYNAAPLSEATKAAFETYMQNGGGLVVVHAADNCWGEWEQYNKMIGVGGWGGRTEQHGPYVYIDDAGETVRDLSPGKAGTHGRQHEFPITVRAPEHPVMKGLPAVWLTAVDECYAKLRGPAENMTILATGEDQTVAERKGQHQPALIAIDYGQGRCFHTILGHDTPAYEGVSFIVTFLRGCEWAATGAVTQPVPADFPSVEKTTARPFVLAAAENG